MGPDAEDPCPWTFEDVCLWTYCLVDELWPRIAPRCARPGPPPRCSDPELVTMALVGECKGWDQETELLSNWGQRRDLFPHQPERSRFNRRRRQLAGAINGLRRLLLALLDLAQDRQCVLDSLPVPVIRFHLVPAGNRAEWQAHEGRFGKVPSKRVTIFGYKLYLLVTLNGVILDFVLAPANVPELRVGAELLSEHTDLDAYGDKAFVSAPVAAALAEGNRVRLWTLPRRNEQRTVPAEVRRHLNAVRQVAETVIGQLAEQFRIEVNHAQSFWGLTARLLTKLTAHTPCLHLNRRLGNPDVLRIKALAFPRPI
jgi:Transposase DDE domain